MPVGPSTSTFWPRYGKCHETTRAKKLNQQSPTLNTKPKLHLPSPHVTDKEKNKRKGFSTPYFARI